MNVTANPFPQKSAVCENSLRNVFAYSNDFFFKQQWDNTLQISHFLFLTLETSWMSFQIKVILF